MKADLKLNKDEVLVVQDFTNIALSKGNRQCLCCCLYSSKPGTEKIKGNYITYTAPDQETKNDIRFVVGAWMRLIRDYLLGFNTIQIWSDGGPKHFKITACLVFFSAVQTTLVGKKVVYHFFPSYHGHSVCDGMASHLKKKLKTELMDKNMWIDSSEDLLKIFDRIKEYENYLVDLDSSKHTCQTLHGIRSFHMFTFSRSGKIKCFKTSEDTVHSKKVNPGDL
jgi:hypothetical protein